MGRRRRDGQRRAAKVEARRRRREAMVRPRRSGHGPAGVAPATSRSPRIGPAEIGPDPGGCEDDLRDDLQDDDDPWDEFDDDLDDDLDDALDDEPGPLEALQDRIRAVVAETVERRDPEVARRFVAGTPHDEARSSSGDRTLIDLFVASWLLKARRRRSDPDLARRSVTWVGEHLGETAPVVADAARMLGPKAAEAAREHFLRTPLDLLVARLWLLAGVVAQAPVRDPVRIDLLSAADDVHRRALGPL
ncbi:hypothetical protein [Actinomycetospora callitridis]|uniref:hypothetical protein n=1 Tax=Actinomycetospora callitridis TaxID=913944 RepID=UPI00236700F6|nr:hypothetical protein [Actinomycetospora callitridis]MDD7921823.1 hypothetical protein [Actinomycetospora callitridis]